MSDPGIAANVSISCSAAMSTAPGTGPGVRNVPENGTPAHRGDVFRGERKLSKFKIEKSERKGGGSGFWHRVSGIRYPGG
jgi:hypothetical protein